MRTSFVLSFSFVLLAAACGDNLGTSDASPHDQPDGPPGGQDGASVASRAVIVSGDFATTGILSVLDLPERTMTTGAVDGVAGADPVIRHIDDKLYIVNRAGGNNITILRDDTLALVDQIGTGAINPQDVAAIGDKLYVAGLAATGLVVIDRAHANAVSRVSLSSLDPDGHPDCVSVYIVGTTAFVACGLLNASFVPRGPGKVAVIDTTSGTLTTTLTLPAKNPFSLFNRTPTTSFFGGDLVIGTVPSFSDFSTGCLARVSVGATPAANGCAVTNAVLGGYANHIEIASEGVMWLAVDGFSPGPSGNLQGIDLESGTLWDQPLSAPTEVITDLAACPGSLLVAADTADAAKGVRVFDHGVEITSAPIPIGLPPAFGANMVCYSR